MLPSRRTTPCPLRGSGVAGVGLLAALAVGCGQGGDCPARYADGDGDGFGDRRVLVEDCDAAGVLDATDCDDRDEAIFPGAVEVCNDRDDDCNGTVDDVDDALLTVAEPRWLDADGDGFGASDPWARCGQPPPLYTAYNGLDCNDADPGSFPGAPERCNDRDDDCNGQVDDEPVDALTLYFDGDRDGYGANTTATLVCDRDELSFDYGYLDEPYPYGGSSSRWVEAGGDCDEGDASVNPGAVEACNGIDDDCDGSADESPELLLTGFLDRDGDGFGTPLETHRACVLDTVYNFGGTLVFVSSVAGDCDDRDELVHPEAVEVCNGQDDDCDTLVDDADPDRSTAGEPAWHRDEDEDGFGDPSPSFFQCAPPSPNATVDASDCDDDDERVHPDGQEVCNGRDDDCDGHVDDLDDSLVGGPCP